MRKGTRRTSYVLTEHQLANLKAISAEGGLSVSELIRRAVDQFLEVYPCQLERVTPAMAAETLRKAGCDLDIETPERT